MEVKIGKFEIALIFAFIILIFLLPVTAGRLFAYLIILFVVYRAARWFLSRKRKQR